MKKFKVGDRVKAIEPVGDSEKIGVCGTVIDVDRGIQPYLVEFDEYIGGHDGEGRFPGKGGRLWWCYRCNIELIDQPKKKRGRPVGSKNKAKDDYVDDHVVDTLESIMYSVGEPYLCVTDFSGNEKKCPDCEEKDNRIAVLERALLNLSKDVRKIIKYFWKTPSEIKAEYINQAKKELKEKK